MSQAPDLYVFDLDGTLVDSLRDLAESVNELLAECGGRTHDIDSVGRMVGEGAATLVARAFAASETPQPPDALARFLAIYDARPLRWTRPYPEVEKVLSVLAPGAVLAVLTNKPIAATRAILDGLRLAPFFEDRVLGGDGPLPRKPDPSGLLQLMSRAGVAQSRAVMVGDSRVDFQTACAAGVPAAMAAYGFGFATFPVGELRSCDRVLATPLDLLIRL